MKAVNTMAGSDSIFHLPLHCIAFHSIAPSTLQLDARTHALALPYKHHNDNNDNDDDNRIRKRDREGREEAREEGRKEKFSVANGQWPPPTARFPRILRVVALSLNHSAAYRR